MTQKPEFVDLVREATRQRHRSAARHVAAAPEAKETSRLSNWPPERWKRWRMENLMTWKLKTWNLRNWG